MAWPSCRPACAAGCPWRPRRPSRSWAPSPGTRPPCRSPDPTGSPGARPRIATAPLARPAPVRASGPDPRSLRQAPPRARSHPPLHPGRCQHGFQRSHGPTERTVNRIMVKARLTPARLETSLPDRLARSTQPRHGRPIRSPCPIRASPRIRGSATGQVPRAGLGTAPAFGDPRAHGAVPWSVSAPGRHGKRWREGIRRRRRDRRVRTGGSATPGRRSSVDKPGVSGDAEPRFEWHERGER
jgi:hypothetical protein